MRTMLFVIKDLMKFREIAAARRAPYNPPKYIPLSPDKWPDGAMKICPKVFTTLETQRLPSEYVFVKKTREDGAPLGRHYMLTINFSRQMSGALLDRSHFPDWATSKYRFETVYMPQNDATLLEIRLPSVTTILDKVVGDETDLLAWRASIGEEKADQIADAAATKGTNVHWMCESYVTTGNVNAIEHADITGEEWTIFHLIRQHLETFDTILGSELTVFNLLLGYTGTIDLVGITADGRLCLIDIKTYGKERKEAHMHKAKLQVTLYAMALQKGYNVPIEVAQIVYANPITGLRVVDFDLADYYDEAHELIRKYYALYG